MPVCACPYCETSYDVPATARLACVHCGGEFDVDVAAEVWDETLTREIPHPANPEVKLVACAGHPERFAMGRCAVCARPACVDCSVPGEGVLYCARHAGARSSMQPRFLAWENRRHLGFATAYVKTMLQCCFRANSAFASVPLSSEMWGPLQFALINVIGMTVAASLLLYALPAWFGLHVVAPWLPAAWWKSAFFGGFLFTVAGSAGLGILHLGYQLGTYHLSAMLTGANRRGMAATLRAVCYSTACLPWIVPALLMSFPFMPVFLYFSVMMPSLAISRLHGVSPARGAVVWFGKNCLEVGMLFFSILSAIFVMQAMGLIGPESLGCGIVLP